MNARLFALVFAGAVSFGVVAGCSSIVSDDTIPSSSAATTAETDATDNQSPGAAQSEAIDSDSMADNSPPVPLRGQPLLADQPLVIVLAPPMSGAGEVPLFRWEAVEGAATYDLVVLGPDGPIWAWEGPELQVRLGGLAVERPEGMDGPVVVPGTCWSVAALDLDRHVIAISELIPVSPFESEGHVCVLSSDA